MQVVGAEVSTASLHKRVLSRSLIGLQVHIIVAKAEILLDLSLKVFQPVAHRIKSRDGRKMLLIHPPCNRVVTCCGVTVCGITERHHPDIHTIDIPLQLRRDAKTRDLLPDCEFFMTPYSAYPS